MVASHEDEDVAQPLLGKGKHGEENPKQTGSTRKVAAGRELQGAKSTATVRRMKPETKVAGSKKAKKKGSSLPPAVMDAVFGTLQKSIPDVEELRRKRQEDAIKCGRGLRTITQAYDDNDRHPREILWMTTPSTIGRRQPSLLKL